MEFYRQFELMSNSFLRRTNRSTEIILYIRYDSLLNINEYQYDIYPAFRELVFGFSSDFVKPLFCYF